jgi:hypothetical protein
MMSEDITRITKYALAFAAAIVEWGKAKEQSKVSNAFE